MKASLIPMLKDIDHAVVQLSKVERETVAHGNTVSRETRRDRLILVKNVLLKAIQRKEKSDVVQYDLSFSYIENECGNVLYNLTEYEVSIPLKL